MYSGKVVEVGKKADKVGYGTACSEDGYCYTYTSFDKRTYFLRLMSGCAALTGLML